MWYMCYFYAIKDKLISFAEKWMHLEIILSKIRQTEKQISHPLSYAESRPKKKV
jgi:hypothetical protein